MASELPDLEQAWNQAWIEFKKAAELEIDLEPGIAINGEDIVNRFDDIKARNAEAHEKINNAKKAVANTIIAIERIGKVAAQGASMVFGPASLTMNCISFLIDAGIEYKDIAHNIDDLFTRIANIMERFQIYRENEKVLHPMMKRMAHRLLMAVVSICGVCMKVLHQNRLLKFAKIALFSSNGGVKAQFSVLASLQDEEAQLRETLTHVATETNKRDTATRFEQVIAKESEISKSVGQLSANSAEQADLKALKERIDFDDTASKKEYRYYQNKLVSGTCSWINKDQQYQSWSDVTQDRETLLVLQGDEGCGKSYALTAIVRDLMVRYPQGNHDSCRTSITYYYLAKPDRKDPASSKSGPSIREAIKSWAWQALNNDLIYRKDVKAALQVSNLGDLSETWEALFISHIEKGANIFLLLDGVHELDEAELNNLVSVVNTLPISKAALGKLKIMISSRPPFVKKLKAESHTEISVMDIQEKTGADMDIYIRNKAGDLQIFQRDTAQVKELKDRVCSGLLQAVYGNFNLVDVKLREIAGKYDPEEVMQIVENAMGGSNLGDSILADIRECNRTLTAREIQNLNTLLLWVIHAQWGFQVYELESVLFTQQERVSLQPLSSEIREKYSAFLTVDSEENDDMAFVTLRYDSIADYFQKISQSQVSAETTANQHMAKGEIRVIQHFIEKLCEQEIYEKLGLKDFFDQKLSQSDTSVVVDCENAHANIALTCLRVLTGEFSKEADDLNSYSQIYLTEHLKKIDLDNTDPRIKAEIGPRLVVLFTDRDSISKSNNYVWSSWAYNDTILREVLRLLDSSAVTKAITASEDHRRGWVDAVLSDPAPDVVILKDAVKLKSELWLSAEDGDDVVMHFQWLYGYLNMIESKKHNNIERREDPPDLPAIDIEQIQQVLQLAKSFLALATLQPLQLRNVGVTYYRCEHIPEAIEHFTHALESDADCLRARASLAIAYAFKRDEGPKADFEKALFHQNMVIEAVKSGMRIFDSFEEGNNVQNLLIKKSSWLRILCRYEEASAIYNDLLQETPTDDTVRLELIYTFCEAQSYGNVVEMLQKLREEAHDEIHKTSLSRFFHYHCDDSTCHNTIFKAYKQSGNVRDIKSYYRQAIKETAEKIKQDFEARRANDLLSYHVAAILYAHGEDSAEKEEGIRLWEQILAKGKVERDFLWPVMLSARRLAKIYIAKAVEAGSGSSIADEMLTRVRGFAPASTGESGEDDISMGLSRADVRSLMGRYYSSVKETDKAREELRPAIEVGVKLLSDEDPENDCDGYRKLADALMDFGDDDNAIAAWCMIQPTEGLASVLSPPDGSNEVDGEDTLPPTNEVESAPAEAQSAEKVDSSDDPSPSPPSPPPLRRVNTSRLTQGLRGPLRYSCDGGCGKFWMYSDDFHVCRQCIDVQFDAVCLDKLRTRNIDCGACDPSHEFLHVPAWDVESAKRALDGKVLVGEHTLGVSEWLEKIQREWGLLT